MPLLREQNPIAIVGLRARGRQLYKCSLLPKNQLARHTCSLATMDRDHFG
jgi:hypothetical protein